MAAETYRNILVLLLLEEKRLLSAGKGTVLAVTYIPHHPLGEDYRGL